MVVTFVHHGQNYYYDLYTIDLPDREFMHGLLKLNQAYTAPFIVL